MTKVMNNSDIAFKNRIEWIDYVKGIAIILVVMGHAISEYSLNLSYLETIIYSMHMPLFFIVSGYLFYIKDNISFSKFIKKKVRTLMVPYVIFCILILVCHIIEILILKRNYEFFQKLCSFNGIINTILMTKKSLFSNLWFLPCMLVAESILYIIILYIKQHKKCFALCTILGIVSFVFTKVYNISLPLCLETALVANIYIYLGIYVRNKKILERIKIIDIVLLGIIFFGINVFYICFFNGFIPSFYNLNISNPIIFFITSITGSFFVIGICMKLNNKSWLQHIGENTIYIYGLHFIIQNIIGIIVNRVHIVPEYICLIVTTCANIMLCMIIIYNYKRIKNRRKNEDINSKDVSGLFKYKKL